jgi:hypothetical protein
MAERARETAPFPFPFLLKLARRRADDQRVSRRHIPALTAIAGVSFVVRMVAGWLRAVPALFPDEYTYAALGRSIADSGHPLVRGTAPHFPALLEPIVTAPIWLIGDVGLAYRLVQTLGALAMSLAAVPAFLLARRVGLGPRLALAAAALSVLVPDLVYASFVTSEALAYPLVLTAVYAATRALARPSRRAQLGFVLAAGLAALARTQFGVLPIVFVLAAAGIGLRERRLRAALREQALALGLFAAALAAVAVSGPSRAVGVYRYLFDFHAGPADLARWAALDAMSLAYAAGWIVVPGALLGLWLSLARPRSRDELAFGAVGALLAGALLLEAGLLQASLPLGNEIQERYVFYAVPLIGIWFALYASRGWPLRVPHLALAAALVLVSVRLPLSTYAVASTVDGSPILYAVYWLVDKLGKPGDAAGLVAAAVGLMSAIAVVTSRRPRLATPLTLGLALLAAGTASAGAIAFDVVNTGLARRAYLPADPSWVDRAGVGRVSLLQAFGGARAVSLQELFWNRSIERVLLLPGALPIDRFGESKVVIGDDGSLRVGGRAVAGPVLVDTFGSTVRLQGARLLEEGPTAALWVPDRGDRPRLALYAPGRYHDGWLADAGGIYVWPRVAGGRLAGRLSIELTDPPETGRAITLTFRLPKGERIAVRVAPGAPRHVRIPVCATGSWYATYKSDVRGIVGLRAVSVRASAPVFTPGESACRAASSAYSSREATS